MLRALLFVLVLTFACPALAQRNLDLDGLHLEFAALPLGDLAGSGSQAVRVTVANGNASPIVVLEAVRRSGESPCMIVRTSRDDFGERDVMEAGLAPSAWTDVASGARRHRFAADEFRRPVERVEGGEEVLVLCTDGWTTTIETHGFGRERVLERNSCHRDAVYDCGTEVERVALAAFPPCARLDPDLIRDIASRLMFCPVLSGERNVAASAFNAAALFEEDNLTSARLPFLLAEDFSLSTSETLAQGIAALSDWRAFVASGRYSTYFEAIVGAEDEHSMQTANVTLLMYDLDWPDRRSVRFARIVQHWRRDITGLWLLSSMQAGQFQTIPVEEY